MHGDLIVSNDLYWFGIVANCDQLDIFEEPDESSSVVTTLREHAEVMVDSDELEGKFYKICTAAGVEGYCLKRYIAFNE